MVSLVWNRSKLNGTVENTNTIIAKTPVEGSNYFDIPICIDNYASTPVNLTGVSITSGSPTVTGTANQLANVKVGSIIVTAAGESDFAANTYVTAKPTTTTLTVSTNALQNQASTTATTTLTVDATLAVVRVYIEPNGTDKVVIKPNVARFTGATATDPNGNGYDEVGYASASSSQITLGNATTINLDEFSTNFGKARTNS